MIKFYDILKAIHLHYSDDYFTQAITERNIEPLYTISGALPITLLAKPRSHSFKDWIIYGNAEGVGQRTKNKLEITATSQTINGVTFTVDKQAGTITANGTANSVIYLNLPINAPSGDYYYSGCALGGSSSTYDLYAWDNTIRSRSKKWDGKTNVDSDYGGTSQEVKVDSEHSMQLTIRIRNGYTCNNLVFKPMLRPADTDADFIPYGYEVPLTISQTGQTDKNYDIFIGDSPLTEVETVSQDTSETHITVEPDLETTISTSLENKPEMKIVYR